MAPTNFPYTITRDNISNEAEFRSAPFRYFIIRSCLSIGIQEELLKWFESEAPWRLVETDFYDQYEFSLLDAVLPKNIKQLVSSDNLLELRSAVAKIFNTSFEDKITLVAHKLIPGQRIAIHNDYLGGGETHRLTVQLNRGLKDENGGLFVLFNSFNPSDIHRVLRPLSGSGIGFEIGSNSNHAVSRMQHGERYTLVYSFYSQPHAVQNSRRN